VLVVLGAVASFFSLSSTVPQVLRAFRVRSADGLSWSALLMNLAALVLWGVYAGVVADQVQLVYNTVSFLLVVALTLAVLRARGCGRWSGAAGALVTVLVSGVAALAVVHACGVLELAVVGTVISSVRMWPQTRLALAGTPLWGLDPWATALGWLGWLLWAAYGVGAGDHALAVASTAGLLMASVVAAFRLPPRRTLHSIAGGRLGPFAARVVVPVSGRFPLQAEDFELVA
jgi:uncharacterized protein with PQ loop repeat